MAVQRADTAGGKNLVPTKTQGQLWVYMFSPKKPPARAFRFTCWCSNEVRKIINSCANYFQTVKFSVFISIRKKAAKLDA